VLKSDLKAFKSELLRRNLGKGSFIIGPFHCEKLFDEFLILESPLGHDLKVPSVLGPEKRVLAFRLNATEMPVKGR
jgi:hypothetical protein